MLRSALMLSVVVLAACAGSGRDARAPERPARVFLSPSGEPFHPAPDEPLPLMVWFRGADADHDGRLTEAEFLADAARFFAEVDANDDGLATSPEVSALRRRVAPELDAMAFGFGGVRPDAPDGADADPAPPPSPQGAPRRVSAPGPGPGVVQRVRPMASLGLLDEREPVLASDADVNRRVTLEEFADASRERFKRLDADQDGALVAAQLQEILAARQRRRR